MIDKTFLTKGYSEDKTKNGYYAEFYPSGQLKHFGFYKNGETANRWALYLDEGKESGAARLEKGSGGTTDWESYRDCKAEKFDAWSDNDKPYAIEFPAWVKYWIDTIYLYK